MFNTDNKKRVIEDSEAPFSNQLTLYGTLLWGPIAGWIITYYSLKKLWFEEYAILSLLSSFIISISIIGLSLLYPNISSFSPIYLLFAFMYFFIQEKYVTQWSNNNPEKKYASNWKALKFIIAWIVCHIVLLFLFDEFWEYLLSSFNL